MMIAMSLAVAWNKPPVWFMDIAGGGLGGWNATAALGPLVRDQGAAALTLYQGFGLLPMFGKNGSCHNRCLPQLADILRVCRCAAWARCVARTPLPSVTCHKQLRAAEN